MASRAAPIVLLRDGSERLSANRSKPERRMLLDSLRLYNRPVLTFHLHGGFPFAPGFLGFAEPRVGGSQCHVRVHIVGVFFFGRQEIRNALLQIPSLD